MPKLYKSMLPGLKASHGTTQFKVGEWVHQDGEIKSCKNGFHCSTSICDAIRYVDCGILAEVEVKGTSDLSEKDKQCWSDMKITKAYEWNKESSVKLAVYAARLVLPLFEKEYPLDSRPRKAIEAAEAWLVNPTNKRSAAAYANTAAAYAANAAAYANAASLNKIHEYIVKEIIPNLKEYNA